MSFLRLKILLKIHLALFDIFANRTLKMKCISCLTARSLGTNFLCSGQNLGIGFFDQTPGPLSSAEVIMIIKCQVSLSSLLLTKMHFPACTQSNGSTNKKQSKNTSAEERAPRRPCDPLIAIELQSAILLGQTSLRVDPHPIF